jgi:Tfp pilus assembly protein PilF
VHDIWGRLVNLRDTNSILKQWWVIPVAVVVLVLGTMLGSGTIGENPFTHLRQAERYLDDGEHTSALDEVSKAIQIEPRLADSYLVRARILADLGDYPSALSELGLAVRLGLDDRDRAEVVALMIELRSRLR